MPPLDAEQVWDETKKVLLDTLPFNLAIFDAFNACKAITLDESTLVLGMTTAQMHMSGHLNTPDNRNRITQILAQKIGDGATYVLIDGQTEADRKVAKERLTRAAAADQQKAQERVGRRALVNSLDDLSQELYRLHSELKNRQFPQVKAKFLTDCLPILAQAEVQMRQKSDLSEDQFIRQFARMLDKLAGMTDVSATLIALEISRYQRARKAQQQRAE